MDNQESGLHKAISFLGKVLGAAVAIMGTPTVYAATAPAIHAHLSAAWGPKGAEYLTIAMGVLEAMALYGLTALVFTMAVMTLLSAWAARRFNGG